MLVNATQQEELRVAMVDGQRLFDLDIEIPSREQRKANIYKGRITRIEPSLEAAFVDFGAQRHGFLPLKEISSEYFLREPEEGGRVNIKDVLKEGQEIVVQVDKEERGTKGAALTTFVSLAGRFLVLMPNNPRAGGVSRRITGEDRDVVREALDELEPPDGMGCIVRTAGVGRSPEELRWDLDYLLSVWEAIKAVVVTRPAPFLIYQEGNAIVRAIRDHLSNEIGEILVDDPAIHDQAREFMERVMPHNLRKLKLYDDDTVPLFTRFQIESQIESAYSHSVSLPSGGSIVIDPTEALTSIDINSARSTKGEDIEETALNTNLEAADEIARQLRIRDVGGLIVIDFIDMGPQRNQREVENRLRDAVRQDRARIQIGRISRFGLLELSRQRLRPSLDEATQSICPRCHGLGNIRSVESLALAVLRLVGEEARKERTAKVIAQLPVDACNFILNEKRDWVQAIQDNNEVSIVLVANPDLETPNYKIRRVRDDEVELAENRASSYRLAEPKEDPGAVFEQPSKTPVAAEPAAVSGVVPPTPAPPPVERPAPERSRETVSIWRRLFGWLLPAESQSEPRHPQQNRRSRPKPGGGRGDRRRGPAQDRGTAPRDRDRDRQQSQGNRQRPGGKKSAKPTRDGAADSTTGGGSSRSGRRSRRRGRGNNESRSSSAAGQDKQGRPGQPEQQQARQQADSRPPASSNGPSAPPDPPSPPRHDDERASATMAAERPTVQAPLEPSSASHSGGTNDARRDGSEAPRPIAASEPNSTREARREDGASQPAISAPPAQAPSPQATPQMDGAPAPARPGSAASTDTPPRQNRDEAGTPREQSTDLT